MDKIAPHIQLRELILSLERKFGILNDNQMACCSITQAQFHALIEIGRAKCISLVELSEILGLDNSTLSRTVNHLVKIELVNRETDPVNRRYITISLTEEGQKIFDGIEAGMNIYYRKLLQEIPQEKQAIVLESIQQLLDALTALERE
jgi:DNA-binding MarR family transcriptional regulator